MVVSTKRKNSNKSFDNYVDTICIPYLIIRDIAIENNDKLQMDKGKIGKFELDKNAFDLIKTKLTINFKPTNFNKNNNDDVDVENNIKNKEQLQLLLLFYDYLKDTIRYVNFNEYIGVLKKVCIELQMLIADKTYEKIFFICEDTINKSNFWVLLLCINFLNEFIDSNNLQNKIYITSNLLNLYEAYNSEVPKTKSKVLIVTFDDMSYSGRQINSSIPNNKTNENTFHIYLGVAFISEPAINIIKNGDNNVKLFNDTQIIKSIQYQLNLWIDSNVLFLPQYFTDFKSENVELLKELIFLLICNYNKRNIANFKDKIESNSNKSLFDNLLSLNKVISIQCYSNIIPIYFDHKLADGLSTFQKLLRFGTYPLNKTNECITTSLIKNCEVPISDEENDFSNVCNTFIIDIPYNKSCPSTFYKNIEYTYKQKPLIKKKDKFNDNTIEESLNKYGSLTTGGNIKRIYNSKKKRNSKKRRNSKNSVKSKKN